ncbi:MAG: extracellular solute-binding protein [Candidatus Limivivens sp.]|nr:extracellular solute-binding protein [Candidatus Limivivens sp.]
MRKNFAKATALFLSVSMMAGMCVTASAGEAELNPAGTYPVVKDGTLEMECFTMSMPNVENLQTNDFTKFLEEKTGIIMDFQTGGRDDWQDKLNMMLQSGDYPDVILGVSPDLAKYGVKEQMIIPLDEYLTEENVPNYLKMMEPYGLDMTKEADGQIYSLADINVCYHCSFGRKMWVNKRYLDEMGCEIPTTTDEFYAVCEKFLEYKPNGIAVAGAAQGWYSRMQDWLIDAFILMPPKSNTTVVRDGIALDKESGEMICVATDDRYKEAMKWINSLYELGAIYDGDFTQTGEQLKTLVNQPDEPVLFFTDGTISDAIDASTNPDFYRDYVCMAPIAGPDGTRIAYETPNPGVYGGAFCITDKCENPEAALRWVDFFYSEIGDLSSQYGAEEGVDWVLNPEGKLGLNGEPAKYEVLNTYTSETQNHDWQDIGIRVAPAEYRLGQAVDAEVDPYAPEGLEKLLYDASAELYAPYAADSAGTSDIQALDELKLTDAESSDISVIAVEVEKIIEETSVAFMTGAKDVDAEWDNFKESLEKAGLQDLIAVYQTAYDRSQGTVAE